MLWSIAQSPTVKYVNSKDLSTIKIFENKNNDSLNLLSISNEFSIYMYGKGHLSFSIDSTVSKPLEKFIYINQGAKYNFARPSNIIEVMNSVKIFDEKFHINASNIIEINKLVNELLEIHENNGYPFAQIWLSNFKAKKDTLFYDIVIEKGSQILFDTLIINPVDIISMEYISTLLDIKKGNPYDESKVRQIKQKIEKTGFLKIAKEPEIIILGRRAKIIIEISKRKTGNFDGIIGFTTNDENKLEFTGNLDIDLINQLKHGEKLKLYYARNAPRVQELDMETSFPYILNTKIGFDYNLNLYRNDSTYMCVINSPGAFYEPDKTHKIGIYLKNQQNNIMSNYQNDQSLLLNSTANLLGISFFTNKADDDFIPSKGYRFFFSFETGQKKLRDNDFVDDNYFITLDNNLLQVNSSINFFKYFSFSKLLKFETQVFGSTVYNVLLSESDLIRIGGIKNFKGLDENSILASTIAFTNLETKLMLESESYISVFYNVGFFERNLKTDYKNGWLHGFGLGMNVHTTGGNIAVYFTLGQSYLNPISLRNAKIHFGYVVSF